MLLNQQIVTLVWGLIFVWLLLVSFFLYRAMAHYQRLTKGVNRAGLGVILEKILKEQGLAEKKIEEIIKKSEKMEEESQFHVQKIGLVRFNPFAETGGDQSFALAILDGVNSGLVILSLHSREATRLYAKTVKKGKVEGYQLSKEEKEAIEKACR